jgi:hypothetical protein
MIAFMQLEHIDVSRSVWQCYHICHVELLEMREMRGIAFCSSLAQVPCVSASTGDKLIAAMRHMQYDSSY